MHGNAIVIDLSEGEAAAARKVLPIISPYLISAVKGLLATSMGVILRIREEHKQLRETGKITPINELVSDLNSIFKAWEVKTEYLPIDPKMLLEIAEIDGQEDQQGDHHEDNPNSV